MQLQALPCKLVPPPSEFLHQGTLKGSAQRGGQRPTLLSPVLIPQSTFDALFFTWQPHYGACAPTGISPIPVSR